jgi:hypothetical protein
MFLLTILGQLPYIYTLLKVMFWYDLRGNQSGQCLLSSVSSDTHVR